MCMSGITTFGAVILTALSLQWMMFLVWWFAFFGFEVLFAFGTFLPLVG